MVLLQNDGTLPLAGSTPARVAVLGPHAVSPAIMGGGSAQLTPHHVADFLSSFADACSPGTDIVYERGCEVTTSPAVVGGPVLPAPHGFRADRYAGGDFEGPIEETRSLTQLRMLEPRGLGSGGPVVEWSMRVVGTVVPEESGVFQFALAQSGLARLFINGELVLDGFTNRPPPGGSEFWGQASQDLMADVRLDKGVPVELVVEYAAQRHNAGRLPSGLSDSRY